MVDGTGYGKKCQKITSRFQKWLKMSESFFLGDVQKCQKMTLESTKMSEISVNRSTGYADFIDFFRMLKF